MREMAWAQAGRTKELEDLPFACEFDMPDRRELDDAVLEMIGVSPKKRRQQLIDELYRYLREFFEWTREKEEKAIANKRIARRRGSASPSDIAAQIYEEVVKNEPRLLRNYEYHFRDRDKPFDVFELPAEGVAEPLTDFLTPHGVRFRKGKKDEGTLVKTKFPFQDELVVLVANAGVRGFVGFPREEDECRRVHREFERFLRQRNARFRELIAERTADEDTQQKTLSALLALVNRS
ncbi:MAG: hypothetical protein NTW86_07000 [Candidatus Sumerlaeota bacterium]|nr:hypothetical protein [Candidatus Sumerlaeota bacterium]